MANAQKFLGYVARVALDRLTGAPERTDEGIEILKQWASQRDPQSVNSGVAEARKDASDPAVLRAALDQAAAESGQQLSDAQRDALEFTVVSGLSSVPDKSRGSSSEETINNLVEQLLPGKSRSYILWLDIPEVVGEDGEGRYFHFSYDGESYRVRDYINGNIFHPAGRRVTEKTFNPVPVNLTASQIWNAGKGQIRCTKEYGLYIPVTAQDEWRQRLLLFSDLANQFRRQ